jgi:hypothetical protein
MIQIGKGQLLLKTIDYKYIRTTEDIINIRLYEVMAGEGSAKFVAGPAVSLENRLAKEEFHGYGATPEEALQDCINKIRDVDRHSMFENPPPVLPPSSVGRF